MITLSPLTFQVYLAYVLADQDTLMVPTHNGLREIPDSLGELLIWNARFFIQRRQLLDVSVAFRMHRNRSKLAEMHKVLPLYSTART